MCLFPSFPSTIGLASRSISAGPALSFPGQNLAWREVTLGAGGWIRTPGRSLLAVTRAVPARFGVQTALRRGSHPPIGLAPSAGRGIGAEARPDARIPDAPRRTSPDRTLRLTPCPIHPLPMPPAPRPLRRGPDCSALTGGAPGQARAAGCGTRRLDRKTPPPSARADIRRRAIRRSSDREKPGRNPHIPRQASVIPCNEKGCFEFPIYFNILRTLHTCKVPQPSTRSTRPRNSP
jgi:hypothetical protein